MTPGPLVVEDVEKPVSSWFPAWVMLRFPRTLLPLVVNGEMVPVRSERLSGAVAEWEDFRSLRRG